MKFRCGKLRSGASKFIMIKNIPKLNKFLRRLIEQEKISHKKALENYEQLHNEAVSLGAIDSGNILNGLEVDIRIAKALNELRK